MRELFGAATTVLFDTVISGFDAELLEQNVLGKKDVLFVLTTTEGEIIAIHIAGPVVKYRPPLSEDGSEDGSEDEDDAIDEEPWDRVLDNPHDLVLGDWLAVIASRYDVQVPALYIPEYCIDYYLGGERDRKDGTEFVLVEFTSPQIPVRTRNGAPIWAYNENALDDFPELPAHPLKHKAVPYEMAYDNELYLLFGRLMSRATDENGTEHFFDWQPHGFDPAGPYAVELARDGKPLGNVAEMLEMAKDPEYYEQHYVRDTAQIRDARNCFYYTYCPARLQVLQYVR